MNRIILVILVSIVASLTLAISACDKKPTNEPTKANATALEKFQLQLAASQSRAKAWQANATLSRVYRQYEGSLSPTKPPPLVFAYASLAEPAKHFEVLFGGSVTQRESASPPAGLRLLPIAATEPKVDPEKALQIAEEAGGKTFREQHLAGYKVLVQLQKISGFQTVWYVRYDTGDGTKLRRDVYVNAESGAIDLQKEQVATTP